MINYCNDIIQSLENKINEVNIEIDDQIELAEIIIKHTLNNLSEVKNYIFEMGFMNQQEEIYFFKELKPKILSKLIYYNSIYRIETKKPNGGERIIRKYYNNELDKLKRYFDNNLEFYKYYRTGSTYLDKYYFVREKHNIKLSLDTFYFEADHRFTTSHDYKVAKVMAHDLIQVYLENELANLYKINTSEKSQHNHNLTQCWTGSKVALVELIYALHSEGVFNNGSSDLKDIVEYFESVFDIDLGQYRRVFLEIRGRKSDRTKFLTALNKVLIKRMDNTDELL
ncbi:RteC domain-containing protein [Flavobacterium sp.]|uniref:RteC domain-containing protein n=1 Tax=Flavobacterium sp. TaxID=239 RepID=UPI002620C3FB|nr:RteC domain-containing protein [Flavobacterium sp.]MDD3005550.1 RteC domain-containing protein [Flavobacterium sp.]